jgi:GMP synthase-like glutamine amidotransferase
MKLQALVLQHQHNAPPALLADWAAQREFELVVVRADRERELPEPDGFGFAVTLGSDHSAGDDRPPWVERELAWLRCAHRQPLPVLGICFGAQALAVATGGAVRRADQPEFGWVAVQTDAPDLVAEGPWFAWHQDVIQLPAVATEIARNDFGTQAFTVGCNLGVQFTSGGHPRPDRGLGGEAAWPSPARGGRPQPRTTRKRRPPPCPPDARRRLWPVRCLRVARGIPIPDSTTVGEPA